MFRKSCSDNEAGFTLIEALVALAIIAAVLGSIGAVIATTVKGTRSIDQRLALSGAAETLLATPAGARSAQARPAVRRTGRPSLADRCRADECAGELTADRRRFVPLAVNMRLQAPGGPAIQFTTVRLVPRGSE